MGDLKHGIEVLAHRGTPLGAEGIIERVEAQLADDPVVTVSRRHSKSPTASGNVRKPTGRGGRGLKWAAATCVAIVGVAAIAVLPGAVQSNDREPVTTSLPESIDTTGMSDVEVVGAGIEAWEAGNPAAVAQLFDFGFRSQWSLDDLNAELAYQARVPDTATVACDMNGSEVVCEVGNPTPMADAVGMDFSESIRFRVEDSTIVPADQGTPLPSWAAGQISMAVYLRLHGRILHAEPWDTQLKEYAAECLEAPREEFCATLEGNHLDGWAAWYPGAPQEMIEVQVSAWFGGDCKRAHLLLGDYEPLWEFKCQDPTIQYETEMEARAEVTGCEEQLTGDGSIFTCEIHYSNVMNRAVDKGPALVTRSYEVGVSLQELDDNYPSDPELMASFGRYVDQQGMRDEYETACGDAPPELSCAEFILSWLDDWATWHLDNS